MNIVAGDLDDARMGLGDEKTSTDHGIAMIQHKHSLAIRLGVSREHLPGVPWRRRLGLMNWRATADGHAPAVRPGRLAPARSIG